MESAGNERYWMKGAWLRNEVTYDESESHSIIRRITSESMRNNAKRSGRMIARSTGHREREQPAASTAGHRIELKRSELSGVCAIAALRYSAHLTPLNRIELHPVFDQMRRQHNPTYFELHAQEKRQKEMKQSMSRRRCLRP